MYTNTQKQTNSGKPVINKETKLPIYDRSVHSRLSAIKKELGVTNTPSTHDQIWSSISNHCRILGL